MTTSPEPPPSAQARAHWTPARQRLFLTALLSTGCVTKVAHAAGMSRSSAHRLRQRLSGTPFDHSWTRALALHAQALADPFAPDPSRRQPPDKARG